MPEKITSERLLQAADHGPSLFDAPISHEAPEQMNHEDAKQLNRELIDLLKEANSLLRSCFMIAQRGGDQTNWEALLGQIGPALDRQRKCLFPPVPLAPELKQRARKVLADIEQYHNDLSHWNRTVRKEEAEIPVDPDSLAKAKEAAEAILSQ